MFFFFLFFFSHKCIMLASYDSGTQSVVMPCMHNMCSWHSALLAKCFVTRVIAFTIDKAYTAKNSKTATCHCCGVHSQILSYQIMFHSNYCVGILVYLYLVGNAESSVHAHFNFFFFFPPVYI